MLLPLEPVISVERGHISLAKYFWALCHLDWGMMSWWVGSDCRLLGSKLFDCNVASRCGSFALDLSLDDLGSFAHSRRCLCVTIDSILLGFDRRFLGTARDFMTGIVACSLARVPCCFLRIHQSLVGLNEFNFKSDRVKWAVQRKDWINRLNNKFLVRCYLE